MLKKLRHKFNDWRSQSEDALPAADLFQTMRQLSLPSFDFFLMLTLSVLIATFGLIADSAPAIIGAMIIAPLMSPIMSFSYGLVAVDVRLISRSALTVVLGVGLVVALAYGSTLLFGLRIVGSEILGRTAPSLIDLGVAMAAGAAAAFAHTRRSIMTSIAGVAIAVALVPPLAVTGIGLAIGRKAATESGFSLSEIGFFSGGLDVAVGSFLLFLTNFIGIVALAILVFVLQGYGKRAKALLALAAFIVATLVIFQPLQEALREIYVKNRVVRLVVKLAATSPNLMSGEAKFESINVNYEDGLLHIYIDAFIPKDATSGVRQRIDRFRELLSKDIGEPVVLKVELMSVDVIDVEARPPEDEKAMPPDVVDGSHPTTSQ